MRQTRSQRFRCPASALAACSFEPLGCFSMALDCSLELAGQHKLTTSAIAITSAHSWPCAMLIPQPYTGWPQVSGACKGSASSSGAFTSLSALEQSQPFCKQAAFANKIVWHQSLWAGWKLLYHAFQGSRTLSRIEPDQYEETSSGLGTAFHVNHLRRTPEFVLLLILPDWV